MLFVKRRYVIVVLVKDCMPLGPKSVCTFGVVHFLVLLDFQRYAYVRTLFSQV